jgi:DoxX-like family
MVLNKMNRISMTQKNRRVPYWATTIPLAIIFLVTGLGNLLPFDHIAGDMMRLGYPVYFRQLLGVWKLLGAMAILAPAPRMIKEWAYAGMFFDLSGAIVSRLSIGESVSGVVIPALVALLLFSSRRFMRVKYLMA